jgi:hypothetical protein
MFAKKESFMRRALLLVLGLSAAVWAVNGDMGVGTEPLTDGSAAFPWLIEDLTDFDAFAGNSAYWAAGVHTQLMTDIDLSGRTYTASPVQVFSGNFDGQNHTVFNLTVTGSRECGLFGRVAGTNTVSAIVKNLALQRCSIISDAAYNGCLIGLAPYYVTVLNCHVKQSQISSPWDVIGGLVGVAGSGIAPDVTLSSCSVVDSTVSGGNVVGGLVGSSTSATIQNCYVNCRVSGGDGSLMLGGLCGENSGSLSNCYSTGTVTGWDQVGGLCGYNLGSIADCNSMGYVAGNLWVGGLCGWSGGPVTDSCSTGAVSGNETVGGLCGVNAFTVNRCYSTGKTEGMRVVGGLCGSSREIINSYSTSHVSGDELVGGLCGARGDFITNSYSIGSVSGNSRVGGLVGGFTNSTIGCYWNVETSGTTDGVGDEEPDPSAVSGKNTSEMMTQSTFPGWDFSDSDGDGADWVMLREGEDYPRLAWQAVFAGDVAGLYGVDLVDFSYLANYWGLDDCDGVDDCGRADIDGSGDVGIGDLAAVAGDWLLK